jgi:nucleotide-binding universal stress UspA family protein
MYQRILVALDESTLAERVLLHAEALAEKFGATLLLLRATMPPAELIAASGAAGVIEPVPVVDPTPVLEAEHEGARRYLEGIERLLGQRGLRTERVVVEGPAGDAIVERATALHADLVAMTTHGRSGLGRLLLGSVADHVVRHAPCPVLLVRVREDE